MNGVKIKVITTREIEKFSKDTSESPGPGNITPISLHRARAWAHNPHAKPDDASLLVAYSDNQCIGYLGMQPGLLEYDGTVETVYWLSTFYVPPEQRGTSVGALLAMRAMSLRLNLAASASSEEAQKLYAKLRFTALPELPYIKCNLQQYNLPIRALRALTRRVKPQLAVRMDQQGGTGLAPVRALLYRKLLSEARKQHPPIATRRLSHIAPADLNPAPPAVRFSRNSNTINWMLDHPWVTTDPEQQTPGHYFADYREHAEYRLVRLFDSTEDTALGFAVLSLSRENGLSEIHVLDHHIAHPEYRPALYSLALEAALEFGADSISLPEDCTEFINHSLIGRRLFASQTRPYYVHFTGAAKDCVEHLKLDYCDGDVPFA